MAFSATRTRITGWFWSALIAAIFAGGGARAADPQPYMVSIAPAGAPAIDAALHDSALLFTLKDTAPVPPFGLIGRANSDVGRLLAVLNAFGYHMSKVTITIEGRAPSDPELPRLLDAKPTGVPAAVVISIDKGPLYRWRTITIAGAVPADAKAALGLTSGAPSLSADAVAAQGRLLTALQEDGYALARVGNPVAYADDEAHVLDIRFDADPGMRAEIGTITIQGLKDVNESFARDALTIHSGQLYKPSAVEGARQALLSSGVFSGVSVRLGDRLSPDGRIPVTFDVEERAPHAVALSGDYATDLGFSLTTSWSHRNLFGNGEQLNLTAAANGVGGTATAALGYQLEAQFIKPMAWQRDQTFEFDLGAVKQSLEAYDQKAETAAVYLKRKFPPEWTGSVGFLVMQDDIVQKAVAHSYQLLQVPLVAGYDTTRLSNPLSDATHGVRASFAVTPTYAIGSRDPLFFILQASASTYFDFASEGRSVLALRALAGSVQGASNLGLPPDQRLYAGGSATVRGFKYQSVGPLFPDGDPVGGAAVDAATIEFRQRLFGDFGAAAFVDAGQASAQSVPFTGTVRIGAGGGVRYYTPIGVVRADIAIPLTPVPEGDSFEIYIGLGQVF